VKPKKPQNAQIIFGDPPIGIANEAHTGHTQIGNAAHRIEQRTVGIRIDRIDREIAPRGILAPIRRESDHRMAPIRLDVAPQGRDLDDPRAGNGGNRAVLDSGRLDLDAGTRQAFGHARRFERRRDIDVGGFLLKYGVAHAAADETRIAQDRHHGGDVLVRGKIENDFLRQCVSAGTSWPFSIWAGS
jgi:hypothetical protein